MPPVMSPLSAQVSFDEDPFLPGSGLSLAPSLPAPGFVAARVLNSSPQMIPMQPSIYSAPDVLPSEGRTIRVSLPPTTMDEAVYNQGAPPQTLPPGFIAQMRPPTLLPTFPLIGGAAPTSVV